MNRAFPIIALTLALAGCTPPPTGLEFPPGEQTAEVLSRRAQNLFQKALEADRAGDEKKAESLCRESIAQYSAYAEPHLLLGLLNERAGQHDEALPYLGRALAEPCLTRPSEEVYARALYARARARLERGELALALADLDVAAAEAPASPKIRTLRALVRLRRNEHGEALADLTAVTGSALSIEPAYAGTWLKLFVLTLRDDVTRLRANPEKIDAAALSRAIASTLAVMQDYPLAEPLLRDAVKADGNIVNWTLLGDLLALRSNIPDAVNAYTRGLERAENKDADVLIRRSIVLRLAGRTAEAADDLSRAMALDVKLQEGLKRDPTFMERLGQYRKDMAAASPLKIQ
jgi:hypothetical protein